MSKIDIEAYSDLMNITDMKRAELGIRIAELEAALESIISIRATTHVANTMGEAWKWKDGATFDEVVACVEKLQARAALRADGSEGGGDEN